MATVNNSRISNLSAVGGGIVFNWWWSLTRSMKKAGWKFKASSNGTTKISSSDPAADQFGTGTVSNAGAAAASIGTLADGRATITGLTNIVAADKGRFLTISGASLAPNNNHHQIEEVLSATSVRIDARNFAVAADPNNGTLVWTIRDPTGDAYVSFTGLQTTVAWWCAQGPSILRIPITSASVGTFIRGENVTQASTGAQGEFTGYIFSAGTGYLVISPRVRGTGTGVHGWQTGFTITGINSGATVAHNGTAIDYVYEMVFAKTAANTALQIFVGQFDTVADSAEMFSFCATQAGCTAAIHPGGGGTGNAFGTKAWVVWGTGTAPGSGVNIPGSTTFQRGNTICVDALPEQGYSADGSWSLVYSNSTSSPVGFNVFGFHKLNDTEDGDLSPYATLNPGGVKTLYGEARTNAGTNPTIATSEFYVGTVTGTANVWFSCWRRRGLSGDTFAEVEPAQLVQKQSAGPGVLGINATNAYRVATGTDPIARIREPIWLVSGRIDFKMFKGTLKWMYWFSGQQVTAVYGNDPGWVQIGTTLPAAVIGPADGTAWVLNA
jgi:hypothetical protein